MVTMGNIRPCVYPGCRDIEGNPRLTQNTICDPSRRHYRRLLDWIALDYITIRQTMPQPITTGTNVRASNRREYGHPAEWASDALRRIADLLNDTEDDLRDYRHDDPAPHPGHSEPRRVAHAHHYLTNRMDDLCEYPGAEDKCVELYDIHGKMRAALGQTRPRWHLPTPCPQCELATLSRTIDLAGTDAITCENCGTVIPESHYEFYARIVLDEILDVADDTPTDPLCDNHGVFM